MNPDKNLTLSLLYKELPVKIHFLDSMTFTATKIGADPAKSEIDHHR
jgi:hypothetical protein